MTSRRPVRAAQSGLPVGLTFYDSAYAAVARARGGTLVTFDTELLRAALGTRPADVQLGVPSGPG